MLILLVRVVFVLLAVVIGLTSGRAFYEQQMGGSVPAWFGGAMGFAVAVTLIAAEQGFRRRFSRSLVAFLLGLAGGLALSWLMLSVIDLAIQDESLKDNIDVPLVLVATYLVMVTVLRNADRFRVILPFVEFRNEGVIEGGSVLDLSALCDGRFLGLVEAGLLDQRLLVHRGTLLRAEDMTKRSELRDQVRGQRAVSTLARLRDLLGERLLLDTTEIPQASSEHDMVLGLARLEGCRLICADRDLAARARSEGLRALDLHRLAESLATDIRPGQMLDITIEKAGETADQGIGYLGDGSMVVVTGGGSKLGQQLNVCVLRLHRTATGRMIFAEPAGGESGSRAAIPN